MNKLLYHLFFLLLPGAGYSQEYLPTSNGEIVAHTYYTLSYREPYKQAEWTYYTLHPEMLGGTAGRAHNFRPDPSVSTGSAEPADYKGSGYDKGHLVPAGDMKMNALAMSESFYMSNMSPQLPSFNRGIWKKLETLVRSWAHKQKIYIVTGGILTAGLKEIGANHVDVPKYFYKIVYAPGQQKMIAFVIPNVKSPAPLSRYAVDIDKVETLTHIDFFPQLSDNIEEKLETNIDIDNWDFAIHETTDYQKKNQTIASPQCRGIAKSTGVRCKNRTKNKNGYCYAHQYQSPGYVKPTPTGYMGQCNAITQKGAQCKRNASHGTRYCWQHQ